jgi:MFS family permease
MKESIFIGLQNKKSMRDYASGSLGFFLLLIFVSAFPVFVMLFDAVAYSFGSPFIISYLKAPSYLIGIMLSAYAAGIAVFSFVGGYLFDKISVKLVLIIAILLFSVFSVLTGFVTNVYELFVFRFLVGAGIGTFQPVGITMLSDLFYSTKARAVGVYATFFSLGEVAAPLVFPAFLPAFRVPFEISGILSLLAIILVILFVPNVYKKEDRVKVQLKSLINRNSIILLVSMFIFGIAVFAGFDTYYSSYLIHFIHLSSGLAGVVYAFAGIGGVILSVPIGMFGDHYNRRYGMILSGILFTVGSLGMFYIARTAITQAIFVFIFGAGFGTFENVAVAFGQDYTPDETAGMIGGSVLGIYNIGAIVGGPLFGYVLFTSGYLNAGIFTVIIPAIIMLIIISFTTKPKYNKDMPMKPDFIK